MITQRLSTFLIEVATRHWPAHLRADVRREWLAELAVLADQRRHTAMLRFAFSLAAHPRPAAGGTPVLTRAWYAARVLLVGPVLCVGLMLASLFAMTLVPGPALESVPGVGEWAIRAQLPALSLMCLLSAYVAARAGRAWALDAPGVVLPVLIATVPGLLVAAALLGLTGQDAAQRHVTVFEIYFLGFAAVLYVAARVRRAGQSRRAWWIAIAGAFAVADLAVIPAVLNIHLPPEEPAIAISYAPTWLPALLTDTGFGLPHPTPAEVFAITDVLVGVPQMLMIITGWALGMVLGRAEPEPAAQPGYAA